MSEWSVTADGSGVEIWLEPRLEIVSSIRAFLGEFVRGIVGDPEAAGRMEIAAQELVENAIKGSSEGKVWVELSLKPLDRTVEASIRTTNLASRWNIACLRHAVDEVAETAFSPQDMYVAMMKRSVGKREGSGLGIGRIRAEADMKVRYDVDGDWVTVSAATTFQKEGEK